MTMAGSRAPSPLSSRGAEDGGKASLFKAWSDKASTFHARVPYLQKLPFSAIAIIAILILVNLVVWAGVAVVLVRFEHKMLKWGPTQTRLH